MVWWLSWIPGGLDTLSADCQRTWRHQPQLVLTSKLENHVIFHVEASNWPFQLPKICLCHGTMAAWWCQACSKVITGSMVSCALGKLHLECLICSACKKSIGKADRKKRSNMPNINTVGLEKLLDMWIYVGSSSDGWCEWTSKMLQSHRSHSVLSPLNGGLCGTRFQVKMKRRGSTVPLGMNLCCWLFVAIEVLQTFRVPSCSFHILKSTSFQEI